MPATSQRHADVMEITLDWPEVRNALGPAEGRQLRESLEAAIEDETIAAIVISAKGKSFCAGGNLPEIVRLAEQGPEAVQQAIYGEFQGVFRAICDSPIPVISAVDGAAVGFGCDLALAGSATFIGSQGWIAQGWIKAGLIPATGGTHYVVKRAGQQVLWRLLAADKVDGPTAEAWGLAIACDDARKAALDMASKLASFPRAPLKAVTKLAGITELQEHLSAALAFQTGFITHPDFPVYAQKLLSR
ncbi:enoyl-CoA hydratase/isomerase family protein [Pseudomonas sp. NFX98]|uniref:enoyl-CoA hydratase/isomerase family protein n=1 Tax=Pseudomonas sp. NFX98 TaxID=3399122 RepID=UPI0039FCD187